VNLNLSSGIAKYVMRHPVWNQPVVGRVTTANSGTPAKKLYRKLLQRKQVPYDPAIFENDLEATIRLRTQQNVFGILLWIVAVL